MNKKDWKGVIVDTINTWQGTVYKNEKAFKTKSKKVPCYIPEYFLSFCDFEDKGKIEDSEGVYFYQDFIEMVEEYFKEEKLSKKEIKNRAEIIFEMVDWQSPETLIYELEWDDFE